MRPIALALSTLLLAAVFVGDAWAKRAPPKPVTPAVHNGVKYVAPNANGREGRIEARDEKSDQKLWEAVVYKATIDPNLEEDVQWVFVTELTVQKAALLVTNEKGAQYSLDLKTRKVKKVK